MGYGGGLRPGRGLLLDSKVAEDGGHDLNETTHEFSVAFAASCL